MVLTPFGCNFSGIVRVLRHLASHISIGRRFLLRQSVASWRPCVGAQLFSGRLEFNGVICSFEVATAVDEVDLEEVIR
jgi:hypothetical protein